MHCCVWSSVQTRRTITGKSLLGNRRAKMGKAALWMRVSERLQMHARSCGCFANILFTKVIVNKGVEDPFFSVILCYLLAK